MSDRSDEQAFPQIRTTQGAFTAGMDTAVVSQGLSKREYFAARAMQAMIGMVEEDMEIHEEELRLEHEAALSKSAVRYADALIAALKVASDQKGR